MSGFLIFIAVIFVVLALAAVLGTCVIGTFMAPLLWMKVVCFAITIIFAIVITLLCIAFANVKTNNKQ